MTAPRVTFMMDPAAPERAAAAFFAQLIYPAEADARRARAFRTAALGHVYRARAADPAWGWSPQLVVPRYLVLDAEWVEETLARGLDILRRERLVAAEMAIRILFDALGWPWLIGGRRASVNQTAALMARRKVWPGAPGIDADRRIIRDDWSPSKPVLHAALAFRSMIPLRSERATFSIFELFGETSVRKLVGGASTFRRLLLSQKAAPRFRGVSDDDLLDFRLIPAAGTAGN